MAFTSADDFQVALNACLTVCDRETLKESIQIPEYFMPLALERLVVLTVQELEVSSIMLDLCFFFILFFLTDSLV